MGPGAAFFDELVADLGRERKVGEVIAVDVAELDPAEAELGSPEAMRMRADSVPTQDGVLDQVTGTVHVLMNLESRSRISRLK